VNPRIPLPPELEGRAFNYGDGRRAGLGEGRLRGGDLARPFHGIRWATRDSLDLADRCRAVAPNLPPGSFFSSATAAALMNVPLPYRHQRTEAIHIAVISPHRALEGRGGVGHKIQLMGDDSWTMGGLSLSAPARAWCELGVQLSIPELVAAGDWMIKPDAPLTSHVDLVDALRRYPDRRGKTKLRIAAGLLDGRAESPMESELRVVLVLAGITGLESNWPVRIGNVNYRIDLAIPSRKVAIEYQGDYHRDPEQWRRDMTRGSRLASDSWFVIQINADDLRDPAELVTRIRNVLVTRARTGWASAAAINRPVDARVGGTDAGAARSMHAP
jgi:very-short-patch-repair endonuclease